MTGQIADKVVYRDTRFDLAGYSGGPLFDPIGAGLRPMMIHTGCWRGFVATYAVADGRFVLHELEVNDGDEAFPPINGVEAEPADARVRTYHDVGLLVPYSGTLQLGTDFDPDLYTHMGFQPAWKYKTVWAVTCRDGLVTGEEDVSEAMRERAKDPVDLRPPSRDEADVRGWVRRTFDRRTDRRADPEPPTR